MTPCELCIFDYRNTKSGNPECLINKVCSTSQFKPIKFNVLQLLKKEHIIEFDMSLDKRSCEVWECCDDHYHITLTKRKMQQLIYELQQLTDTMKE